MGINIDLFRQSMGLFPGAVTLITTGSGTERRGITATAVCSVSDTPPSLLICVNRKSGTCDEISRNGRFSVQLLDESSSEIAMAFAGARKLYGAEKFSVGEWGECGQNQPRLMSALASLSCRVSSETDSGSHRIFIGEIEDVCLATGNALVYAQSQFRRLEAAI